MRRKRAPIGQYGSDLGFGVLFNSIILSVVVIKWLKALLARVTAIEIALYCFTWLKKV